MVRRQKCFEGYLINSKERGERRLSDVPQALQGYLGLVTYGLLSMDICPGG